MRGELSKGTQTVKEMQKFSWKECESVTGTGRFKMLDLIPKDRGGEVWEAEWHDPFCGPTSVYPQKCGLAREQVLIA